ncbi:MAG TPA: glycerophosphodiester phosphodiesterase family protein [Stellaceae bacterium]
MNRPLSLPRVIGHRGAAARAPENTLAGFRRAAELGCRWVEFDVRLSRDGQPILLHDATLGRTTDGRGAAALKPLDELQRRDAGAWFGTEFRGEAIPTLDGTLALLHQLGLGGNLEMKASRGRETALAAAVSAVVRRLGAPALPSLLVTSFSVPALAAMAREAPLIPRGLLVGRLPSNWHAVATRLGAVAIVCDHARLRLDGARAVRATGLALLTYTVNEPARARELFGWDVDAVISDAPDTILAMLAQ